MMKQTTFFEVEINPCASRGYMVRHFAQVPSREELIEVINSEIAELENTDSDDPTATQEKVDRLERLHIYSDVVSHSSELVEPLAGSTEVSVKIAGVKLGTITVKALPGFTRDPDRVMQELVA